MKDNSNIQRKLFINCFTIFLLAQTCSNQLIINLREISADSFVDLDYRYNEGLSRLQKENWNRLEIENEYLIPQTGNPISTLSGSFNCIGSGSGLEDSNFIKVNAVCENNFLIEYKYLKEEKENQKEILQKISSKKLKTEKECKNIISTNYYLMVICRKDKDIEIILKDFQTQKFSNLEAKCNLDDLKNFELIGENIIVENNEQLALVYFRAKYEAILDSKITQEDYELFVVDPKNKKIKINRIDMKESKLLYSVSHFGGNKIALGTLNKKDSKTQVYVCDLEELSIKNCKKRRNGDDELQKYDFQIISSPISKVLIYDLEKGNFLICKLINTKKDYYTQCKKSKIPKTAGTIFEGFKDCDDFFCQAHFIDKLTKEIRVVITWRLLNSEEPKIDFYKGTSVVVDRYNKAVVLKQGMALLYDEKQNTNFFSLDTNRINKIGNFRAKGKFLKENNLEFEIHGSVEPFNRKPIYYLNHLEEIDMYRNSWLSFSLDRRKLDGNLVDMKLTITKEDDKISIIERSDHIYIYENLEMNKHKNVVPIGKYIILLTNDDEFKVCRLIKKLDNRIKYKIGDDIFSKFIFKGIISIMKFSYSENLIILLAKNVGGLGILIYNINKNTLIEKSIDLENVKEKDISLGLVEEIAFVMIYFKEAKILKGFFYSEENNKTVILLEKVEDGTKLDLLSFDLNEKESGYSLTLVVKKNNGMLINKRFISFADIKNYKVESKSLLEAMVKIPKDTDTSISFFCTINQKFILMTKKQLIFYSLISMKVTRYVNFEEIAVKEGLGIFSFTKGPYLVFNYINKNDQKACIIFKPDSTIGPDITVDHFVHQGRNFSVLGRNDEEIVYKILPSEESNLENWSFPLEGKKYYIKSSRPGYFKLKLNFRNLGGFSSTFSYFRVYPLIYKREILQSSFKKVRIKKDFFPFSTNLIFQGFPSGNLLLNNADKNKIRITKEFSYLTKPINWTLKKKEKLIAISSFKNKIGLIIEIGNDTNILIINVKDRKIIETISIANSFCKNIALENSDSKEMIVIVECTIKEKIVLVFIKIVEGKKFQKEFKINGFYDKLQVYKDIKNSVLIVAGKQSATENAQLLAFSTIQITNKFEDLKIEKEANIWKGNKLLN